MTKTSKITSLAVASAMTAALTMSLASVATAKDKKVEKCYGVVKAGKNDCATASSSCAGTSVKDGQKDAWIYVPKGTCEKLSGGSTSAG